MRDSLLVMRYAGCTKVSRPPLDSSSPKSNAGAMIPKYIRQVLPAIGALLMALVCGYLAGRVMTRTLGIPHTPLTVRQSSGTLVATVSLEGIENGMLRGVIHGGARFVVGSTIVVPDGSGAFRVPAQTTLKNIVHVSVPDSARFVASKRGKKYYPVNDPAAAKLSAANRVFFLTTEEAEKAGYRR